MPDKRILSECGRKCRLRSDDFSGFGRCTESRMSIRQIMLEPVKISRRIRDREMLENRLREILKRQDWMKHSFRKKSRESFPADRDRELP